VSKACRLYLISPPAIERPAFADSLRAAFDGGDVGCFQLRLKDASDDEVLRAAEALIPICHAHDAAFIMNDRPDLAVKCGADGVHLGQEDLQSMPIKKAREIVGNNSVIGVSCHDSKHLGMLAGEQGADYVAFGAFHETQSKDPEKLAKYGVPTTELLRWWSETMLLPCVAIGGITPTNCVPKVSAGADFIAVITAIWSHPDGQKKAVEVFNEAIERAS